MSDFRLKVFLSVARNLNFTKASKELFISQPAISKHIQELENKYGITLFNRSGNKISLTQAGKLLVAHAEDITEKYRKLDFEMSRLAGNFTGELRIGASTTIAQYLLPPILAKFMLAYPKIKISLISENSSRIEALLHNHEIDLGLVEGSSRCQDLRYVPFLKDELVLVGNTKGVYSGIDEVTLDEIKNLPLIFRENGSGTLAVIEKTLERYNIRLNDLNIVTQIGRTEGIKKFIMHSDCLAILSVIAITDELLSNRLRIVDTEELSFEREFAFVSRHGTVPETAEQFMEFARIHNPKLSSKNK